VRAAYKHFGRNGGRRLSGIVYALPSLLFLGQQPASGEIDRFLNIEQPGFAPIDSASNPIVINQRPRRRKT